MEWEKGGEGREGDGEGRGRVGSTPDSRKPSRKVTVVGISRQVEHVKRSISSLLDASLLGAWEMQLVDVIPDNVFHGVQLTFREQRRPAHHYLVTDIRDISSQKQHSVITSEFPGGSFLLRCFSEPATVGTN